MIPFYIILVLDKIIKESNMKQYFKTLLAEQTEMALATSVKDIPNVRIVNFYYDEDTIVLIKER